MDITKNLEVLDVERFISVKSKSNSLSTDNKKYKMLFKKIKLEALNVHVLKIRPFRQFKNMWHFARA